MPLRIVHCSDVHLETTFPEVRGGVARRRALEDAFVRIVDFAITHDADIITISGDLYEAERLGPQSTRFLFGQFARFEKQIFIAPGNHDPYVPTSPLARTDLPANVIVFNEAAWREHPVSESVSLYGFGHTPADPGRPLASARFEGGTIRIALVHGSDESRCPPGKRVTAPFTRSEVIASGATLLLTGHYHGGYIDYENGKPLIIYPGSPEPIKFGEDGFHGLALITVNEDDVEAALISIAQTNLRDVRCDISHCLTDREVASVVKRHLAAFGNADYVRVRLVGTILPDIRIDCADLAENCGSHLGSLEIRNGSVAHDYDAIAREPTVRGHVVRDLLALGAAGIDALRYALAAFDGAEIVP